MCSYLKNEKSDMITSKSDMFALTSRNFDLILAKMNWNNEKYAYQTIKFDWYALNQRSSKSKIENFEFVLPNSTIVDLEHPKFELDWPKIDPKRLIDWI